MRVEDEDGIIELELDGRWEVILRKHHQHHHRITTMAFPLGSSVGFVYLDTPNPTQGGSLLPNSATANMSASNSAGPVTVGSATTTADVAVTDANGGPVTVPSGTTVFTLPAASAADTVNITADVTDSAGTVQKGIALAVVFAAAADTNTVTASAFKMP